MNRHRFTHPLRFPGHVNYLLVACWFFQAGFPPATAIAQGNPADTWQVAILLPMSGPYGHLGEQVADAIRLAWEDCNGLGFSFVDTAGDPQTARMQVYAVADDPTHLAIIGPLGVAESDAAALAAQQRAIPILSLSSELGLETIGDFVFRLRLAPQEQSRQIARIALNELGLRRFAVLYPDDPFGRESMRAFADEIMSAQGQLMGIEAYPVEETDFSLPVELLTSRRYRALRGRAFSDIPRSSTRRLFSESTVDFEAVFIPEFHEQVALILHFLAFYDVMLGRRVQLLGISSWGGRGLMGSPQWVEGALFTQIFHPQMDTDAAGDFVVRYSETYSRSPSEAEAQTYDAIEYVCALLASSSGTIHSRSALRDLLLNAGPREGLTGPIQFDPQGRILRRIWLFQAGSRGGIGPYTILR